MAKILPSANGKNILESSEKLGFFNFMLDSFLHFSPSNWHFYQRFGHSNADECVFKKDNNLFDIEKLPPPGDEHNFKWKNA